MTDDVVVSMAEVTGNGMQQSPEQALQDALDYVGERGAFKSGKKLLVLALDDNEGIYHVNYIQAGMRMSECLALCRVAETLFLSEMNYIPGVEDI